MSVRTIALALSETPSRSLHGRHDPARLYSGIRALFCDAHVAYDALIAYIDDQGETQLIKGLATEVETVNGADRLRFDDGFLIPLRSIVSFAVDVGAFAQPTPRPAA